MFNFKTVVITMGVLGAIFNLGTDSAIEDCQIANSFETCFAAYNR